MFIYKSKRWQTKRSIILKRDGYRCQWAARSGRVEPADTVHHIFPVEDFPQYAMCDWNLISLSNTAHNAMHDRVTRDLTEEGMLLMKETARKQGIDLMDTGVTLIVGRPNTGKSTLARKLMTHDTLVYDMDEIAEDIHYSREHVISVIHSRALQDVGELLTESYYDHMIYCRRQKTGSDNIIHN